MREHQADAADRTLFIKPNSYDPITKVTIEYREAVKAGFNHRSSF